ncbi:hypothetical protein BUALT_Bualt16G0048800 [Buddleja alternifolia]|uniref:J domain-containing protein n=1 Tax=Buddleja alternifolia TaxID=168488 RepID=A0AAV6WAZ2_9LAMI|nr:hypothetical protein BUALT_Bualt16G0048800 [Buddleja alternifolia]
MECNKDEAVRAKQLAEKKMEDNDFEGARKIVSKAQNLYPELENINQLLSICDVHCSAQKRMFGPEKDWYGILQAEKFADELTVKKQYRRLALHLHPDKNRFPGAEAAFKLICEANAVLSDPAKKSVYDSKIRVKVRSAPVNPPPHHMNRNTQFNKQYGARNNVSNGFTNLNQHQATQSNFSVKVEGFWTSCPFCSSRYQFDRKYVNVILRCQKCLKNFTGYEISVQGVPMGSKWVPPNAQHVPLKPNASPSAGFQQKGVPDLGKFTTGVQNDQGFSATQMGPQRSASRKPVRPEPGVWTESTFGDAIKRETGKNKTKKRGRKMVVESSESFEISSESDLEDVTMEENFLNRATGPSNAHFPRRSSRKRQHVSYNEGGDDDFPNPPKKSQASELSEDNVTEQKDAFKGEASKHDDENSFTTEADFSKSESKETGTVHTEESLGDKDANHDTEVKARGEAGGKSNTGADTIEIESDSDQDPFSDDNSDKGISQCVDPEFNDFDKNRDESCFAVNQFWALYDNFDNMPRFYAKVKKVHTSPFELSLTWLEADPIDDAHMEWIDGELPVGCGSFKLGKTDKTSLRLTFSHQLHCAKGKKRGSLVIYPRKGEVWALYNDWDISWGSEPENHKDFKYEVVEVLADFDAVAGIKVCYLDKIEGFVSLFQRSSQRETDSFLIGPNELYKFSHFVPSFKMTGTEREGVPVGSFELDPACLPLNLDDLYYPSKAKMESENIGAGGNFASPKSATKMGDFVKSETSNAPKEFVDMEGIDEESLKPWRSPRGPKCKVT